MRYRLRTLLILLALGPPVIAAAWIAVPRIIRFAVARYEGLMSV